MSSITYLRSIKILSGLTLVFTALVWSQAPAADPAAPLVIDLPLALATAQDVQPSMRAARATLSSAQTAHRTLEELGVAARLTNHDLPIRKKQACLGVTAATGNLIQAEAETKYAVLRTYWSVQYAKAQQKVAAGVVESFEFYEKRVSEAVKKGEGPREWTQDTVDKISIYRRLAANKVAEADRGIERATAGLKEAIGLDPCSQITVVDHPLTELTVSPVCREDVVSLALSRRGEVTQANALAEIMCLEIEAQGKECLPGVVRTFAAFADIHSKVLPAGVANGEYRPGALAPEMPTHLAGSKSDRMQRARDLADRGQAVSDKVRNLVALEAQDIYWKHQEALKKVGINREGSDAGRNLSANTKKGFTANLNVRVDDILTTEVLAAQAQSAYNEALWQLGGLAGRPGTRDRRRHLHRIAAGRRRDRRPEEIACLRGEGDQPPRRQAPRESFPPRNDH